MADMEIAVLLSTGMHPVSGKPRMAPEDARAAEMALRLGLTYSAIHAGDISNVALRDYLGLGVDKIEVLGPLQSHDDIVPPLVQRLSELAPDIVLTGSRTEKGEASGMVPYQIAQQLKMKHIAGVCSIEALEGDEIIVVQGYKGVPRRKLAVKTPVLLSVSELAPLPRMRAFARARVGKLEQIPVEAKRDDESAQWTRSPARRRPKKITPGQSRGGSEALVGLTPKEAAMQIASFLKEIGVIEGKKQ
ncbi:hypothetical protein [Brucella tritici]|uniref:Electron transfer flavoprotein alpha/beta-subunit N-terminal domain-containing protein n=1 Tax=Brucella tritici TaxID=94626 RepID=A0A6L3Y522_9HYPH|nr:hypothetical protein [Brucella tritici]KAB2675787.1 hypothetical protein F9L08_27395 [Brucella tritici]